MIFLGIIRSVFSRTALTEYRRYFLYIFSSKLFIVAIGFLTTPILARIFHPSDYGLFALLTTLTTTLSFLTNLSLPAAILVCEKEKLSAIIAATIGYMTFSNLFFFLIGLVVVSFFSTEVLAVNISTGIEICVLVTLCSIFTTVTQILANLNIREKAFKTNVAVSLVDNLSMRTLSISLGLIGITKLGLFYSELAGKTLNALTQLALRKDRDWVRYIRMISRKNIATTIQAYRQYPLYNLPTYLLSNFSTQIVLWLLAIFFSIGTVGHFTMSMALLGVPLQLFSNSLQPLITKKLSDDRSHAASKTILNLIFKLMLISAGLYLTIYLLMPFFITIYLGQKWVHIIPIVRTLCIAYALQLVGNSMSGAFIVFNKQKANLIMKIIFLSILVTAIALLANRKPGIAQIVEIYSAIVALEELAKILYISFLYRHVTSS